MEQVLIKIVGKENQEKKAKNEKEENLAPKDKMETFNNLKNIMKGGKNEF